MFLTCALSFFRLSRTGIRRKHYCVRHMCSKYRHLNTVLSITYTDWSKTSLLEPARHAAIHPHQCLPSHKDHPYMYTHTLTLWKHNIHIQPSSSILKLLRSRFSSNLLFSSHFYSKGHESIGNVIVFFVFISYFMLNLTNIDNGKSNSIDRKKFSLEETNWFWVKKT